MGTLARTFIRATIRTRVAIVATLLSLGALLALGYQQLSTMSQTFSRVAHDQSLTLTSQLSSATAGASAEVAGAIPFTRQGLDGVVFFDRAGRVRGSSGALAPVLRALGGEAREVAKSGRALQEFRLPMKGGGSRGAGSQLRPWSASSTLQVTIVPQADGALAAGFHLTWATTKLRATAISTVMALVGGALFLFFGLTLTIGRLVTRPLGRLGSEVRALDAGSGVGRLSEQSSPELRQLAADIEQMHADLTRALADASTDPLTGVANHRAFHDRLDAQVDAALATGEPLSLLAIDLDRLKPINDRWGHVAGDRVIEAVAQAMVGAGGDGDLCARTGGDEFAIVCAGRDRAAATALGDGIAAAVGRLSLARLIGVPVHDPIQPSISFGVATLAADAESKEGLIDAADAALYRAKRTRAARPDPLLTVDDILRRGEVT
jgi:diguanylate cyclase (GGDEF)-like protein